MNKTDEAPLQKDGGNVNFLTVIAFVSLLGDKFRHTGPPVLVLIQWHPQVGKKRKQWNTSPYRGVTELQNNPLQNKIV